MTSSIFQLPDSFEDGVISGQMPVVQPATCADGSFTTGVGSTCQNKVLSDRMGFQDVFFFDGKIQFVYPIDSSPFYLYNSHHIPTENNAHM